MKNMILFSILNTKLVACTLLIWNKFPKKKEFNFSKVITLSLLEILHDALHCKDYFGALVQSFYEVFLHIRT